jgi:WD40 repeat protein
VIILQGERERVETLRFSPDGRRLVALGEQLLQFWEDVSAGSKPEVFSPRWARSVRFTPDGQKLLLGGYAFAVLDLATKQSTPIAREHETFVQFDLTPDGQAVVFVQMDTRQAQPGRLYRRRLSDLSTSEWAVSSPYRSSSPPLFLADGKRFVVFESWAEMHPFRFGMAYVTRDVTTGAVLSELVRERDEDFEDPVHTAYGGLIAARRGNRIAVFRADDFATRPTVIRNDNRKAFTGLAFHPSGRFLAATSNDATVKFYDTTTWRLAHAFDWDVGRLRSIAFSPDGMLAAAGGDKGKIVIWDFDL